MGRFISVSFGLLVVFLSLSGTGADCPSDWSSHEGHCYKVFNLHKTWEDAEKFCMKQANGGHIVSIESMEEAEFVAKLVSQNIKESRGIAFVWIGLRDQSERQHCSSEWSDGSSINYQNWIEAESRKCLGLEKETGYRKWVNIYCGLRNPFTCEI